ncbi:MAG: hypothetical protein B7X08_06655 [Acidocella sp. 20-63-7]|nr:MAG: hypothetical protein B7X08_06655 [Acidocella sp. 20-63-7]HQT47738.1 glycosyltransferase family 9 protein [Acidocella sp.]
MPNPKSTAAERVVVFRYDKVGDLIVTSPLFRAIKEHRPDAHVTLVCSPYNRMVLENLPEIDQILVYDPQSGWRDKFRFMLTLRSLKPTTAFVLSPDPGGYWLGWLSGARRRAGVIMSYRRLQRMFAPLLLTETEVIHRNVLDRGTDRTYHQSEVALRLAARFGFARPADIAQRAPVPQGAREWVTRNTYAPALPQRRILLHLGATWRSCGLSEEYIPLLVQRIHDSIPGAALLLTAGPAEPSYFAAMRSEFSKITQADPLLLASPARYPRAILCSGLSLSAWSALIESASLVVTPDTGAVHFASAHRRPVVAVYAPKRYHAMTSLFGPWETTYRTLRGEGSPEGLCAEILNAIHDLLAGEAPAESALEVSLVKSAGAL